MISLQVQIVRYESDSQPGWVECQMTDVHGRCWSFIEKVPIVSKDDLDETTPYPVPGLIGCEVVERTGRVVRIDTSRPWYIESIEGEMQFEVDEAQLLEE